MALLQSNRKMASPLTGSAVFTSFMKEKNVQCLKQSQSDVNAQSANSNHKRIKEDSNFSQSSQVESARISNNHSMILSLPLDTMHFISSFLKLKELSNFSKTCKAAQIVSRDIMRRVRMHAFSCAVEVVSAWELDQHEDARELAAVYLTTGVPIYSTTCLGHSFHTIKWRMDIEINAMEEQASTNIAAGNVRSVEANCLDILFSHSHDNSHDTKSVRRVDPFYRHRRTNRNRNDHLTLHRRTYLEEKTLFWSKQGIGAPNDSPAFTVNVDNTSLIATYSVSQDNLMIRTPSQRINRTASRKDPILDLEQRSMAIFAHSHLLEQHHEGCRSISNELGELVNKSMSLCVDFFHPSVRKGILERVKPPHRILYDGNSVVEITPDSDHGVVHGSISRINSISSTRARPRNSFALNVTETDEQSTAPLVKMNEFIISRYSSRTGEDDTTDRSGMDVQSTSNNYCTRHRLQKLRAHVPEYYTKLSRFIEMGDYRGYDECLLDFWDEYFPMTKGVHFHNAHTAIPRMTFLDKFLSAPCPKVWGTIQCEIVRVKSKRSNARPAFNQSPSYEYVMFVKDNRREPSYGARHQDVLLMTAKVSSNRNGFNNYCLAIPTVDDIESHISEINTPYGSRVSNKVKLIYPPKSISGLRLGYLQSNFARTEFLVSSLHHPERYYDFRFRQSALSDIERSSTEATLRNNMEGDAKRTECPFTLQQKCRRWYQSISLRQNRAVAASLEHVELFQHFVTAVSYSAHFLGTRPRLMDVSVPKVLPDESVSSEWNRICEGLTEKEVCRKMLSKTKRTPENERNDVDPHDFGLLHMQNRSPWWNEDLQAYVLNFNGRVSEASVKNFQLCEPNNQDNIILQFGRISGRHSFTVDFSYPLSPMQAFAISLSSMQSKISF